MKVPPSVDHLETTKILFQKPGMAAAYLNSVLDDEDPRLLLVAIRNVAEAFGGLNMLAQKTGLNRENLYRMLSLRGNPEIHSLQTILDVLGLKLTVEEKTQLKRAS